MIELEDFGLACLRGMGWNEEEGIGKRYKKNVKLSDIQVRQKPRPRGLGLGYEILPIDEDNVKEQKDMLKEIGSTLDTTVCYNKDWEIIISCFCAFQNASLGGQNSNAINLVKQRNQDVQEMKELLKTLTGIPKPQNEEKNDSDDFFDSFFESKFVHYFDLYFILILFF
jgi:hypothetical protein